MFDLARRFGITVIEVDEVLPRPVLFDRHHGLAFVSGGLCVDDRLDALDWLLSEALRDPASRR